MSTHLFRAAAAGLLVMATAAPSFAQERRDEGRHEERREWRDRDIARFHERDIEHWRRGRWERGRFEGRDGWWWIVGGLRYYYPAPVYPYPDPYQPPVIAAAPPPPPGPPPPRIYYYCDNPPGYYPYVPACPTPWRAVPGR